MPSGYDGPSRRFDVEARDGNRNEAKKRESADDVPAVDVLAVLDALENIEPVPVGPEFMI